VMSKSSTYRQSIPRPNPEKKVMEMIDRRSAKKRCRGDGTSGRIVRSRELENDMKSTLSFIS
jgi:hypothetical protein